VSSRLALLVLGLSSCTLIACTFTACTFNASAFEREVRAESEALPITRVRADLRAIGRPFDDGLLLVRGVDRANVAATVRVAGLLAGDTDPEAIAGGVHVALVDRGDGSLELQLGYDGPELETVYVEEVEIEVPLHAELELTTDAAHVEVVDVGGAMFVETGIGAVGVRGAGEVELVTGVGSIDVEAGRGVLSTGAGRITMALTGDAHATTSSGSIVGTFGLGGEVTSGSGTIDVELVTPLDRDLTLQTRSTPILLQVPAGAGFVLDTMTGSGAVIVEVGDVSHAGADYDGPIGGGGAFVVRASSDGGPIEIRQSGGG
jgi:hypothetical protein